MTKVGSNVELLNGERSVKTADLHPGSGLGGLIHCIPYKSQLHRLDARKQSTEMLPEPYPHASSSVPSKMAVNNNAPISSSQSEVS